MNLSGRLQIYLGEVQIVSGLIVMLFDRIKIVSSGSDFFRRGKDYVYQEIIFSLGFEEFLRNCNIFQGE